MANVNLSREELDLVTNAGFILTKNRIIGKVYDMFGSLSETFRQQAGNFPVEMSRTQPKISKGENYQGLPWVMMDYPRLFSKTDVFAVRCFFWWGNFFSMTLQLSGNYLAQYASPAERYLQQHPSGWWISAGNDQWEHHFEPDNYQPYTGSLAGAEKSFLKLAKKIPLQEWDNAFDFFCSTYNEIQQISGA